MTREQERVDGELVEPGRVRLESRENPDAWIEAEYRDEWALRKLATTDSSAYGEMTHPYYQQCPWCREYKNTQLWGYECSLCPTCEQVRFYTLRGFFTELYELTASSGEEVTA